MGERTRLFEALGVLVLLALVGLHAAAPISCTDFFWHLKLGEIIASEGSIPRTDMFSAVHPDSSYVQPQWLWEWWAALVYALGGLKGVRIAQALVLVASFAGLYFTVRRATARISAAFFVSLLGFTLFEDRFRARPDAMTLGFVVLSLPILLGLISQKRARLLYTFALMVLWANVHGGASVLLLLSLLALSTGSVIDHLTGYAQDARAREQLQLLLVASVGFFCSPTLLQGLAHWAALIGPQIQTGNEEWMPTYTALRQGVTPATVLIATAPSLVSVAYSWEQIRWTRAHGRKASAAGEWLLCVGYLVLSQQAIRNVFLCIVPIIFMLRRRSQDGDSRPSESQRGRRWLNPALAAAAAFVGLITLHDVVQRSYGGIAHAQSIFEYDLLPDTYPEEATDFLQGAGIQGGIFNHGPWGGYLIHRGWPQTHVFVDTRQNLTPDMWRVYMATLSLQTRDAALDQAWRRWGVDLVMLRGPTFALGLPPAHWQLLYKAGDQEVYQHRGGRHARDNERRAREWLNAHGGRLNEDLTESATRVGAATWLANPFHKQQLEQALAGTRSTNAQIRRQAQVRVGEIYYRAGLLPLALEAFAQAERSGPVAPRTVYLDAFCSFASGDHARSRSKLHVLRSQDLSSLSRRQKERLIILDRALAGLP